MTDVTVLDRKALAIIKEADQQVEQYEKMHRRGLVSKKNDTILSSTYGIRRQKKWELL